MRLFIKHRGAMVATAISAIAATVVVMLSGVTDPVFRPDVALVRRYLPSEVVAMIYVDPGEFERQLPTKVFAGRLVVSVEEALASGRFVDAGTMTPWEYAESSLLLEMHSRGEVSEDFVVALGKESHYEWEIVARKDTRQIYGEISFYDY